MWATLGCATVTACPSPYADEAALAPDAGLDAPGDAGADEGADAAVGDATVPPDAAACDLQKPFGAPVMIPQS